MARNKGWELNLVNRRSSIELPNFKSPNSLYDVINYTIDWFNLCTEVNVKMPSSIHCLGV